jgi:hypothetical protein
LRPSITVVSSAIPITRTSSFLDNGGAVFNAGQLAVYNSVFADNAAFSSGGSGGAIDNLGGTVFVHGSQFFRNRAYRGGAISNRRGGTITVMNTTFGHNVGFEGGALLGSYAEAAFSTVVVHHCTFFRNGASWGGAIELMNGKLLVENSRITENSALHGGGISLGKAELRIVNSDVSFNGASFSGGGIYSPIGDVITLVNSDVTSNSALSGGGVYLSSTSSLTLIRSDVVDNMLDNVYQVPAFTISPTGLSGPTLLER